MENQYRTKRLVFIGPAIWNRIPEILKKTKNLNTLKHKMKHYYLNDLSNPNLWNIGGFDCVLAIIKNIFLFIKQIFLHRFFPTSLWLKGHNENKAIRLFCVILAILFFFSLMLLLNQHFFFVANFFVVWLFNFIYTYLDRLFFVAK